MKYFNDKPLVKLQMDLGKTIDEYNEIAEPIKLLQLEIAKLNIEKDGALTDWLKIDIDFQLQDLQTKLDAIYNQETKLHLVKLEKDIEEMKLKISVLDPQMDLSSPSLVMRTR